MRFLFLCALACLSGCAYVGDPKPPALHIPSTVLDLRALQYGEKVLVEFTLAPLTTDGLPLEGVRAIELRVTSAGMEKIFPVTAQEPGVVKADFPISNYAGKSVTLAVRATGPKGKTSAWSNVVPFTVGQTLRQPIMLTAMSAPIGVQLNWSGNGPHYRVFRALADADATKLADTDSPAYLDATAESGMPYRYFVQAIDGESHQSEISSVASITPVDTFPPAVPSNVSAVAGIGAIELSWDRNTEPDFSSYNVYRALDNGAFEKIAGSVDVPTYSDRAVTMGRQYRYAITSVDQAGNESERSVAVAATAP